MFVCIVGYLKQVVLLTFMVIGLSLVELVVHPTNAWSDDTVSTANEVCYTGLLPRFIKNPRDNKIYFISYSLLKGKKNNTGRCDPREIAIYLNELSSSGIEWSKTCSSTEPDCLIGKVFAEPIALGEKDSSIPERITDWSLFKKVAYPELDFKWWFNTIHGLENLLLESIISFNLRVEEKEFGIGVLKEEIDSRVIWGHGISEDIPKINDKEPERAQSIKSHYGAPPFLSSNACWMIVPKTERYHSSQKMVVDAEGKKLVTQDSRVRTNIKKSRQNLTIYSLDENRSGKMCKYPAYRVAQREIELPEQTVKHLFQPRIFPAVENATETGVDYSAFSPLESPEQLHLVYQTGFPSDSCYPRENCKKNKPNERNLSGDLIYSVFRRDKLVKTNIDMVDAINLTQGCDFGWEYKPSFSRDKKRLLFLANKTPRDDKSKTSLYIINVDSIRDKIDYELKDGEDSPTGKIIEKHYACDDDMVKKITLGERDFNDSILNYSLSSDSKKLQITFEERGESVVHFYKFDVNKNEIVYQYPESIRGIGKIYEITQAGYLGNSKDAPIYYAFHSHLNYPVSISRCHLSGNQFICGERISPIQTTKIGRQISTENEDSNDNRSDKVSIGRTTATIKNRNQEALYDVDIFILHPGTKSKGAIVSVHGGPYEAWDGRFSPRDHRLAQLGYTLYLPNPTGSTGYGQNFTDRADGNWGTVVFEDIQAVINHVKDLEPDSALYLMGFSFGGYMVNRIQTHLEASTRLDLDAMIAVNPLFDFKNFASSTDQLWFPEFHLGCSFPESRRVPFCERNPNDTTCQNYNPDICKVTSMEDQNPANFIEQLSIESPPTLFIIGDADQRIPFIYNVPSMLNAYRKQCAPHTLHVEKFLGHGFPNFRAREQGDLVNSWLQDLACLDNKSGVDKLTCKTNKFPEVSDPLLYRRDGGFLFDNMIEYLPGSMLDHLSFDQCPELEQN